MTETKTRTRSPFMRLLSAVTALGSAVCMLPAMPSLSAAAASYDLRIGGTTVTSTNASDILGDGVFSYDAYNQVLTVKGDYTCTISGRYLIESKIDALTINVASDSNLEMSESTTLSCVYLGRSTTITGAGKLKAYSYAGTGIFCNGNLTIQDADVNTDGGMYGIYASSIEINRSDVDAVGTKAAVATFSFDSNALSLSDCEITAPQGAYFGETKIDTVNRGVILAQSGNIVKAAQIRTEGTSYDLWVCGTQVKEKNAADILDDGVFSYDAGSNTLNVSGNATYSEHANLIKSEIADLTINVAADSELKNMTPSSTAILLEANTKITGSGALSVFAPNSSAILIRNGQLTLENANISARGTIYGINGYGDTASLVVDNSNVYASGSNYGAIVNFKGGISITGCFIQSPDGGMILNGAITDIAGTNAKTVQITPGTSYGLQICGVQVQSENADDILGNGVFSYDDETRTLTIFGDYDNTSSNDLICNDIEDLTIFVASDSTLTNDQSYRCITSNKDMKITGGGKLTINASELAIFTPGATLTIEDADLDVTGKYALTGSPNQDKLIVINSTIHAVGSINAICDFENGIELQDCHIAFPEGAHIQNDDIVNSNNVGAKEVTIEPDIRYGLTVAGVKVTSGNCTDILGNGKFSFDPATNTLTLNGDYTLSNNLSFIWNDINGLTVYTNSDSTISCKGFGIQSHSSDITVTGPGKLSIVTSRGGIYAPYGSTLTIKDANIDVRGGYWGISGETDRDKLVVINSTIHAEGSDEDISDFEYGIELRNCHLTTPEGALIKDGCICNADGSIATVVDIVPGSLLAITKQPENASGVIGDKAQFTVEAEGDGLKYQWQYYNTDTKKWENTGLTGNKTATLTVGVLANRNNMKYHCVVKDSAGNKLVSTAATLKVDPKIVTQPADASGAIGDKVQFTVEATGVDLKYQWQYYNTSTKKWENTGLTGNKTATLTVTVTSARNGMKYHCIVKDTNGTKLTSTAAKLTVNPKIVTQPADASGAIGDKVQFTVEATGVGLIYQWQYYNTDTKKWENTGLTGNKTATLTVTVTSGRNNMKYHCIVKDSAGTKLTSTAATLKVLPKIVTQPQNVSAAAGSTAKFTVEATGIGLTYQWQYYNTSTKKWENTGLSGNKTATLSVTAISSRNGMKYHCIVKDSAGNKLTSTAATLTVK